MAPLTKDSSDTTQSLQDRKQCWNTMQHKRRKLFHEDNGAEQKSPYDEALGKDLFFMAPIRRWEKRMGFVTPIRWTNVITILTFHAGILLWVIQCAAVWKIPKWQTVLFAILMGQVAGFGITGGVHRFWSHRSYKAKWPLQVILMLCYSAAGQNTIYQWVRDHRVHHKFSESIADPHDNNRGFFFSHMGWLMMKKRPEVLKEGNKIDMSDITNDPIIQFHTRYFHIFKIGLCFVIPSLIPRFFWGETWEMAIFSQLVRFMISLNCTWSVNSFAHSWGNKPYDRYIMPTENKSVSIITLGEGWHNYHHTFPWDYKAGELGSPHNTTTHLLDLFAQIGWAYDLKAASPKLVRQIAKNRGDLSKLEHH